MTMTHPTQEAAADLFARIVDALEQGGRLTDTILDYIDASLFPPEPDRLKTFLTSDDDESERDSLLDLIFYPGPAVQRELEPLLEAAALSVQDEARVRDRLLARPIDARIRMADGDVLATIPLPDFIKSQYLERLNLSWQVDPPVLAAIQNGVSAASAVAVKVRLRNARFRFSLARGRFLCRFFERMTDGEPDYLACLDLALTLVEDAGEAVDMYDRLVAHKRFLSRSLQQAQRFDALLRRSNMETLMLQGVRAPHAPYDELSRHMRLIDRICFGIFGKTETIAPPLEQPLRHVSDQDGPEAMVRSFLNES
jgi:hypothetical protein